MPKMGLSGVAFWLLVPALAHPEGQRGGFGYGLVHPLHGLDQLAAMVAVGLWAGQLGGRFLLELSLALGRVRGGGGHPGFPGGSGSPGGLGAPA